MRLPAILFALPILAGFLAVAPASAHEQVGTLSTMDGPGSTSSASQGASFAEALNRYRADNGLGPVRADGELTAAAQAYARDMASNGYFAHRGRDGSNAGLRATRAGCSWRAAAENLALGQTSEGQVLQGWADSAGHRRNLLARQYTRYGLGRAGTYWVLMFADQC